MYHIDFERPCHVHFIGIGGISMSGLAEILLERGFTVSGSDARESELTKKLEAHGAKLFYGQKAENIMEGTDVAVSYTHLDVYKRQDPGGEGGRKGSDRNGEEAASGSILLCKERASPVDDQSSGKRGSRDIKRDL